MSEDGIFQNVVKLVGDKIPYPLYEVPFNLRGEDRIIQYTLFKNDDGSVGSNSWLKCKDIRDPGKEVWEDCTCCPELNAVEDMAMLAIVVADVAKPGEPIC